jgi:hypothetical protein
MTMGKVEQFAKETAAAAAAEPQNDGKEPIPFADKPAETAGADGDNKDYGKAAKLIARIEVEQAKIDKHAEDYKKKAAPHRDEMAKLRKEVRDDCGIEASALSITLAERRQKRRMDARKAALEDPAKSQFKQLEMAL